MTGRPQRSTLADELAAAIVAGGPAPGSQLAGVVGARKATVLRALREARRFERVGRGPSSAWRLAGTGWEPIHGDESVDRDRYVARAVLDAFATIEARLAAIERRLAELEPARATTRDDNGPLAGQLTVDAALARNGEAPA